MSPMLHIGKINLKALLFNPSPGSTSIKQLVFNILRTGTSSIKDERELQRIVMVNALSFALVFMTSSVGIIFYLLSGKLIILIPALVESVLAFYGLYFNRLRKHRRAALFTYYLQCCAALYFGVILGEVIQLHLMIIFLILIALRIFPDKEQKVTRTICLLTAIAILVIVEVSKNYHFVQIIPADTIVFGIFKYLALAGVGLLIYIIGKPYVQSNDALILSNDFKRSYLARTTHELRNKINNINTSAFVLGRVLERDGNLKNTELFLDTISLNGELAGSIVNSVLSMAKVESGEADPITEETFFVNSFFTRIINSHRILAATRGLGIEFSFEADAFSTIKTDLFRLQQIFTNLLGNAIKYADAGTPIRVHRSQMGQNLIVSVINKGKPIPPSKQQSIFEPYVTNKNDPSTEGTGMGLFIALDTAKALGGEITLECSSGEVNFTFLLPVSEGNATDIKPEKETFDIDCLNLKILVVDDDRLQSMVLKRLIEDVGGSVNCVGDGEEAIVELQKQSYDLIITDMFMPNRNGLGLLKYIRESNVYNSIPIILYTAESRFSDETPDSEYSFDGVLHKPLSIRSLRNTLEKYKPAGKLLVDIK